MAPGLSISALDPRPTLQQHRLLLHRVSVGMSVYLSVLLSILRSHSRAHSLSLSPSRTLSFSIFDSGFQELRSAPCRPPHAPQASCFPFFPFFFFPALETSSPCPSQKSIYSAVPKVNFFRCQMSIPPARTTHTHGTFLGGVP